MLEAYVAGEPIQFRLPMDEDNPTWFFGEPINDKAAKRWKYLREYAEKKAMEAHRSDSVERIVSAADAATGQERVFLAQRISKIENAPPDGRTITDQTEIQEFIGQLLDVPLGQLFACLSGMARLKDITFRGDPVPGVTERTEQGGGEGPEGGE